MTTELVSRPTNSRALTASAAAGDALISRAAQEVQAAIAIAKRFPRDEEKAITKILQSCRRIGVAEDAEYEYPRGDTKVTGPTIRLAEVIAQSWGNLDFGLIEIDQIGHESHVLAYAWDLESNTRSVKQFKAKHIREKKSGNQILTDPRDVYEVVANFGSRRTRACLLAVIPKDVVDLAVEECRKTINEADKRPTEEKIRSMIAKFAEFGVTQEMLVTRLHHKLAATTQRDILQMSKIYNAIRDGMGKIEDYFVVEALERPEVAAEAKANTKSARMAANLKAKSKAAAEPAAETDQGTPGDANSDATPPTARGGEPEEAPPAPESQPAKAAPAGKPKADLAVLIGRANRDQLAKLQDDLRAGPETPAKAAWQKLIDARASALDVAENAEPKREREPGEEG